MDRNLNPEPRLELRATEVVAMEVEVMEAVMEVVATPEQAVVDTRKAAAAADTRKVVAVDMLPQPKAILLQLQLKAMEVVAIPLHSPPPFTSTLS